MRSASSYVLVHAEAKNGTCSTRNGYRFISVKPSISLAVPNSSYASLEPDELLGLQESLYG